MSKREKIIVALMIASIIFGAYYFLSQTRPNIQFPSAGHKKSDLKENLVVITLSEREKYVLRQAPAAWAADPFIMHKPKTQIKKVYPPLPKGLKYSGYLKAGNRMIAIINGMEYQIGEVLSQTPYIVSDISSKQVMLALPGGINSGSVPISDSDDIHENKK